MSRFSLLLTSAVVAATWVGCNHKPSNPAPATTSHRGEQDSPLVQNDRAVEGDDQAIVQQARKIKHELDQITAEAADAQRKTAQNLTAEAQLRAKQLSERA